MGKLNEIGNEFRGARLGDERRAKRASYIVSRAIRDPRRTFPKMFSRAGVEAFYRLVNNPSVDPQDLILSHAESTVERVGRDTKVLVVHDTTDFRFTDGVEREGLGIVKWRSKSAKNPTRWRPKKDIPGFRGHFSLAVSGDGLRRPLGALSLETLNRRERRAKSKKKLSGSDYAKIQDKESLRWINGVAVSEQRLGADIQAVHVMDREGDIYWLLDALLESERKFVIRAHHDRRVLSGKGKGLWDELTKALEVQLERTVPLTRRPETEFARDNRRHPPRLERNAKLQVRSLSVRLKPPAYQQTSTGLSLNVVWVKEVDAPEPGTSVEWVLYTTDPVDSPEDVARVVDAYRARWLIEEYFKAIKTGCQFQKRRVESYDALVVVLALLMPVAWKLLELRHDSRHSPTAPAESVLTTTQLDVLRALTPNQKLTAQPTLQQALLAVAELGGHLPQNGPPGWQVLGRGLETLLQAELGWAAAMAQKCDQS